MADTPWTPGPWFVECVSDAVRVCARLTRHNLIGSTKIIIGRFNPKQLPESETQANATLCAASPDLYEALETLVDEIPVMGGDRPYAAVDCELSEQAILKAVAALLKANPKRKTDAQ